MHVDPVCGMEVDEEEEAAGSSTYEGVTYWFCAPGCTRTFDRDPATYATGDDED